MLNKEERKKINKLLNDSPGCTVFVVPLEKRYTGEHPVMSASEDIPRGIVEFLTWKDVMDILDKFTS